MASDQPQTRQEKGKVLIAVIVIAAVLLIGYIFLTSGIGGIYSLLKKFITFGIIFVIIGLIVWVVMKLLQKPKVDLVANDKKDIIEAAILSKPPMVKDIWFTGDKQHGAFRLGKVIGYCQIQSYKDLDILAGLTDAQIDEMEKNGEIPSENIIKEDIFIFKRFVWPFTLFEEPKVLRTFEDEHSQLIGDVQVYGVSVVQKFGYLWPNRAHLDVVRIDVSVIREAWRGAIHQFLKDQVAINQRASGLDSEYNKELGKRKLLKIPGVLGGQEERQ
jgi:hypothetical protein